MTLLGDVFAWLLTTLLVAPMQAELAQAARVAHAPAQVVAASEQCVAVAGPALARRAVEDPFWGITTVISLGLGLAEPVALLRDADPACGRAVAALGPQLRG